LDSGKFEFSDWTLLLADKTYGEGYQNEVLPGVDIRRTCMLRFDGPKFEGVITIVDDCRRKVKE
jgi:hypothetical protein